MPASSRPSKAPLLSTDAQPAVPTHHDITAAALQKPAPAAVVSAPVPPRAGSWGAAVSDAAASKAAATESVVSAVTTAQTEVQAEVVSAAYDATSPAAAGRSAAGPKVPAATELAAAPAPHCVGAGVAKL